MKNSREHISMRRDAKLAAVTATAKVPSKKKAPGQWVVWVAFCQWTRMRRDAAGWMRRGRYRSREEAERVLWKTRQEKLYCAAVLEGPDGWV